MKKRALILLPSLAILGSRMAACEICTAQQPPLLRGLIHGGAGPQGGIDYLIVIAFVVLTLVVLLWAIKCLAWPGEGQPDHIKRIVLNSDYDGNQRHR